MDHSYKSEAEARAAQMYPKNKRCADCGQTIKERCYACTQFINSDLEMPKPEDVCRSCEQPLPESSESESEESGRGGPIEYKKDIKKVTCYRVQEGKNFRDYRREWNKGKVEIFCNFCNRETFMCPSCEKTFTDTENETETETEGESEMETEDEEDSGIEADLDKPKKKAA